MPTKLAQCPHCHKLVTVNEAGVFTEHNRDEIDIVPVLDTGVSTTYQFTKRVRCAESGKQWDTLARRK